jgi:salicylate hydroxylase
VVGAGIGGLTTALALSRTGRQVTLIERRTGFSEAGAGLQLSPNATRILTDLGLGPALARAATEPSRVVVRSIGSGRQIGEVALGRYMRERHGAPYYVLHRADLQTILLDAVRGQPGIRLLMGRGVVDLEKGDGGAGLLLERSGGAHERLGCDFVVGADGVWSKIRPLIGDLRQPGFQGHVAWRATIERASAPRALSGDEMGLWLGSGGHVVHYPIAGGKKINIVAIQKRRNPVTGWSQPGDRGELLQQFSRAAAPLRALVETPAEWLMWSLYDLPAKTMASGRVALLGDAAHPVLPFLAQGAALAIEDAACLVRSLGEHAGPESALAAYARQRLPRAGAVQQAARRNGSIYHAGTLVALGRNFVMGRLGPERMTERYGWIYGWRSSI